MGRLNTSQLTGLPEITASAFSSSDASRLHHLRRRRERRVRTNDTCPVCGSEHDAVGPDEDPWCVSAGNYLASSGLPFASENQIEWRDLYRSSDGGTGPAFVLCGPRKLVFAAGGTAWPRRRVIALTTGNMYPRAGHFDWLRSLLEHGAGVREAARLTGCSKNTASKLWRHLHNTSPPMCACGRPSGHRGWCSPRIAKSPARQAALARMHASQRRTILTALERP